MASFIEIPVLLIENDPDDELNYEDLGIERSDPQYIEGILLNVDKIERINTAASEMEYRSVIWTNTQDCYHCCLTKDELKEMIASCAEVVMLKDTNSG